MATTADASTDLHLSINGSSTWLIEDLKDGWMPAMMTSSSPTGKPVFVWRKTIALSKMVITGKSGKAQFTS